MNDTLVVTTVTDVVDPNDGELSLREAIGLANGVAGDDLITFADNLAGATLVLTQGQLEIEDAIGDGSAGALVIDGDLDDDGAPDFTVDADGQSRVVRIDGVATTIDGLTITGGRVTEADSLGGSFARGGGIANYGAPLTIKDSVISGNETTTTPHGNAAGGGVFSNSDVTITDSMIRANNAEGTTLYGGYGGHGRGGAVYTSAEATIAGSAVTDNTVRGFSTSAGGGVYATALNLIDSTLDENTAAAVGRVASGGGASSGSATIVQSKVSGNEADGYSAYGGGVDARSIEVTDSKIIGNRAGASEFGVAAGGGIHGRTAEVTGSIISGNNLRAHYSSAFGGGMDARDALIANSIISDNEASSGEGSAFGGGIHGRDVMVMTSTIDSNRVHANYSDAAGGGISSEKALVLDSAIIHNEASNLQGSAYGGGVHADGLTMASSTAYGNVVRLESEGFDLASYGSAAGGAAWVRSATITNATITDNRAASVVQGDDGAMGGGLVVGRGELNNTIVAENSVSRGGSDPDISGRYSGSRNLIGGDADLGPLRDNGGLTETRLPRDGSPVIDAGSNEAAADARLINDQRGSGYSRFVDGTGDGRYVTDIGAAEAVGTPPPVPPTGLFVVTTEADVFNPNNGAVSLREALAAAENDPAANTITFDARVSDIYLALGQLEITRGGPLTIDADLDDDGAPDVTVSGEAASRVLRVQDVDTTIDGLTINNGSTMADGPAGSGAGILVRNAALVLEDSAVTRNATVGDDAGGGGIAALGHSPVTLINSTVGLNGTRGDGAGGGGISVSSDSPLSLIDSTISSNSTRGDGSDGGGILAHDDSPVTLTTSVISRNYTYGDGAGGGGVQVDLLSPLTLIDSTISYNSTDGYRSGGGGVSARVLSPVSLTSSTISNNSTAGFDADGGAIKTAQGSEITLSNSTIANNSTTGARSDGGGIRAGIDSPVDLINSTVTGNFAADGGGLRLTSSGGTAADSAFANSIVAGNAAGDVGDDIRAPAAPEVDTSNLFGEIFGFTPISADGVAPADVFAGLVEIDATGIFGGMLANNGGPTETVLVLEGGLAQNTGSDAVAEDAGLTFDQRGSPFERIFDGQVDIGSVELQPGAPFVALDLGLDLGEFDVEDALINAFQTEEFSEINVSALEPNLSEVTPPDVTSAGGAALDNLQALVPSDDGNVVA